MMGFATRQTNPRVKSRQDQIDYNLIYAVSFATCLAAAAGERLVHWSGPHGDQSAGPRKSLLQQARSDASTVVEFAFMQ